MSEYFPQRAKYISLQNTRLSFRKPCLPQPSTIDQVSRTACEKAIKRRILWLLRVGMRAETGHKLHVDFAAMRHASDNGSGHIAGRTFAEPMCSPSFGTIEETQT
ncbi:hypothetical protein [Pararhizobium antarcticum]|uniref:Uncharacterized protein n=1 Tax=Pararhizobium antarcticum TaxID=1798805 RepID=A0A657M022_9HYPH|nr:hypothetical protein [Pararhizobium antarcticum]OJF96562.1 hypothetical protein AX761_03025 [Rhizobium sp. 58]OJG01433.1 hypothetical protein AX760_00495 [Pararhizobium antarcticum]